MNAMNRLFQEHLRGDKTIWMVALLLGMVSLLAVYSSIASLAFKREGGSTLHFLFKHGMMLATGGVIMYYAHRLKFGVYSKLSQLLFGVTVGLLVLTLVLGTNLNDASRWLRIPIIGQSFQTSDLAKVVLIVYLARVLGKRHDEPWTFRDVMLKLMLPIGAICGTILPANFSTAALLFLVCMVVLFIGGVPLKWIGAVVLLAVGSFALLIAANEIGDLGCCPAWRPGRHAWSTTAVTTATRTTRWNTPRSRSPAVGCCPTALAAATRATSCRTLTPT
jgi:cell division protein FtsW